MNLHIGDKVTVNGLKRADCAVEGLTAHMCLVHWTTGQMASMQWVPINSVEKRR